MSRRSGKHARRDTGSTTGVATGVLALLSAGTLAALGVVTAGDVRDLGGPPAAGRPGRTAAAPSDVVVTPSPTPGGSTGGPGPSKTHQGGGGGPVQLGSFLLGPGGVSLSATGGATPAAAPTPGPAPSPAETPPAPPVVVPVALPSPAGHVQAPRPVHPVHPVHPTHPADTITMFALTPAPEARVSGHGVGNLRASEVSGKPVKASKPGAPLTPVAAGQAVGQRPAPTAGPAAKPGKGPQAARADKPDKPALPAKGPVHVAPSVPATPAPTPTVAVTPTVGVEHGKALGHATH